MNLYKTLPLEAALKEALFELGATDKATNAVSTIELAHFLAEHGFPKKGGRTYQGDEHVREIAVDLASIAKTRPMHGWHHFVGGHASDPWNNYEWCVAPDALRERPADPAPAKHVEPKPPERAKPVADMDRADLVAYIESKGGKAKTFPPTKIARLREIATDLERGKRLLPIRKPEPASSEPAPVTRSAAEIQASIPKVHMA